MVSALKFNNSEKIFGYDPPFYKQLAIIAIPIVVQNLVAAMLNMVDNVMVGGLGKESLAAVGIANQIFFIFVLVLFGINAGTSVFIAQFWGRESYDDIKKATGMGLIFSFAFGISFMLIAVLIPDKLISIFTTDRAVIDLGVTYLKIVAFGYPLSAISMVYAVSMRATEKVNIPLISSVISLGLNTILNYSLIYGNFGFPALGVSGAAIATVISRTLEIIIIVSIVYYKNMAVACKISDIKKITVKFVLSIFKISVPVLLNESLWVLGTSVFAVVYGRMGTDEIASFNIVQTLDRIAFVAVLGLGNACAVIVGKQIGAGRPDRAFTFAARSNIIAPIVGITIAILTILVRYPVISLYDVPLQVRSYASTMILISALSMPVRALNFTNLMGVMRAGGDAHFILALEAIPLWTVAVPLTIVGGLVLGFPIPLVYLLALSEELIKCILGIYRFLSKKWIRNLVVH